MEKCAACCQAASPGSPFFCNHGLRSGMTGVAVWADAASAGWSTPPARVEIATSASPQIQSEDRADIFFLAISPIVLSVRLLAPSIGLNRSWREWAIIRHRGGLHDAYRRLGARSDARSVHARRRHAPARPGTGRSGLRHRDEPHDPDARRREAGSLDLQAFAPREQGAG